MVSVDRLAVAEGEEGGAGGVAFGLGAAGQVVDAAEGEHLAAVFGGGDVADGFALGADDGAFGAEVAVGVDFELGAAVAEDRLGDDGDHVGALDLAGDDEGGGLVVGVGGAGADAGDEVLRRAGELAVPFSVGGAGGEGDEGGAGGGGAVEHGEGVGADDAAAEVAVAVAGAGLAGGDVAHHRAGVAADLVRGVHGRAAGRGALPRGVRAAGVGVRIRSKKMGGASRGLSARRAARTTWGRAGRWAMGRPGAIRHITGRASQRIFSGSFIGRRPAGRALPRRRAGGRRRGAYLQQEDGGVIARPPGAEGGADDVGEGGEVGDRVAGGVADGGEDGRGGGDEDVLAEALGAEGAFGVGGLDEDGLDFRDVADGGDEVVVQVVGAAGEVFLHEREADALGDAALDLAFGEGGVDGAAEVVGGGELQELHGAEGGVDGELGDLGAVAVDGVGGALAVGVEGGGGRVVAFLGGEDVALGSAGRVVRSRVRAPDDFEAAGGEGEAGVGAGVGVAEDGGAQAAGGGEGGVAGDVGLAGGGGLCRRPA